MPLPAGYHQHERNKMRKLAAVLLALGLVLTVGSVAQAANHKFPGCHGKNSTTCRPDPQPSHGKDCIKHGKGGINEDHCAKPTVTPTPTPTPTQSETPKPKPKPKHTPGAGLGGGENTPLAKTGASSTTQTGIAGVGLMLIGAGLLPRRKRAAA